MLTRGALLWEPGTRSGWSVEEIELDPPKAGEALIELAASGLCHSDDHIDSGDIEIPFAPLLGGHEGAGIGDTAVVIDIGGVGINAVQGFRAAGAAQIVAVDPVAFKREKALEFGATHAAASYEEAMDVVGEITHGVMADRAVFTVGVGDGTLLEGAAQLIRKGGVLVFTSAAPMSQETVSLNLYTFAMSGKRLQGTLFGSCNPANDIKMLLDLYRKGSLMLDELVTRTYALDDINQGYTDMREGTILRGLITYG